MRSNGDNVVSRKLMLFLLYTLQRANSAYEKGKKASLEGFQFFCKVSGLRTSSKAVTRNCFSTTRYMVLLGFPCTVRSQYDKVKFNQQFKGDSVLISK